MKKNLAFIAVAFALLLLGACQTTSTIESVGDGEGARAHPINVQEQFIIPQALEPQALDISSGNLFDNSGFESSLEGWTACSAGAIKTSGDAYEGTGALEVIPDNCFYRSAEVSAGDDLIISCYAKVLSGSGWTGMGLGFADSSWTAITPEAPATVITGSDYARYDVKFTAPANTKYASMWLFSENPVVVDNCSLMLESEPPLPPVVNEENLLENSSFWNWGVIDNRLRIPSDWSVGCGGSVEGRNTPERGIANRVADLTNGACIDQSLSASDIVTLKTSGYTYSCFVKNKSGYASMSIFLDGQATSTVIPVSDTYQLVEIKGVLPQQTTNGFISVYSESNLSVDKCEIRSGNSKLPTVENNLLSNSGFEDVNTNNQITGWSQGCGGLATSTLGRNAKGVRLDSGVCFDQGLSNTAIELIKGKTYTYSCYVKSVGRYASMSIFFDGIASSKVIQPSLTEGFQRVSIEGTAPDANSGFVSIYSDDGVIFIDDCSLTVTSENTGPTIINESRVLNVQGNSFDIEGNRMVVGNPLDNSRGENTGKVTVYSKTTSGWAMTSEIFLSDAVVEDRFGYEVKLYGGKIYATALGDRFIPTQRNLLHIFKDDGNNNWVKETSLGDPEWTPYQNQISAPTYSSFGSSLEVSEDFVIVSAFVSFNGNTFGRFANLYIYDNRIGESYRLLKDVTLFQALPSKIQYDNQNLYIRYRDASRNGTGSNFVNIRGENVGGENNWGSVDTLSYFPGRISAGLDSRFFRLNDFFFANNFEDGNIVYQRSTNATDGTDSWANIGKVQEIFSSFPLADNSVVIGGIGNNALFAKREGAVNILASENPIYVIDVSNSTPANWSVNYTLVPRSVTSDEVFGEHVTDGNTLALATRDGSTTNSFQSILTFDIP